MEQKTVGLDLKTPINDSLSAFYKRSFAFHTVHNRMPVILTQTIDGLVRVKESISKSYGEKAAEDLKTVIGELSKLKYELLTNKPLRMLDGESWDIQQYNKYLEHQSSSLIDNPTFYNTIWLHSECYMYRRIREAFELTTYLKDFDPFETKKIQSYESAIQTMSDLGRNLLNVLNESGDRKMEFVRLLKINLWGNKCDLSLSNGIVDDELGQLAELEKFNEYILCDHSDRIWDAVNVNTESDIIDIVLDNVGYELYTDLCIADFLITNKYATKIRFYVKTIPWFISDVMKKDFNWTLNRLSNNSDYPALKKLGDRWQSYIQAKTWTIEEHDFWTLPVTFQEMTTYDVGLYKKLSQAKLIIFKGDLNYRKLFGERNWMPDAPVEDCLQGFHPSKLCSLRTLKADIICGLRKGLAEEIEEKSADWLVSGNYGVIQFCDKVVKI